MKNLSKKNIFSVKYNCDVEEAAGVVDSSRAGCFIGSWCLPNPRGRALRKRQCTLSGGALVWGSAEGNAERRRSAVRWLAVTLSAGAMLDKLSG